MTGYADNAFLPCDAKLARYQTRRSVCLSQVRVSSIETDERIELFLASGSYNFDQMNEFCLYKVVR